MRICTTSLDIPYERYSLQIVGFPEYSRYYLIAFTGNYEDSVTNNITLAEYSTMERGKAELRDIQIAYTKGFKTYKVKEEKTK